MRAGLVTAKYRWFEVGDIRKGFINFQAQSLEACPICKDHKELVFRKVTEVSAKPKRGIIERIGNIISNPHSLIELSEMMINVEKLKNASEIYFDFLGIEKTTILIRSLLRTWKTTVLREIIMALKNKIHDISSLPCYIWISYRKSLSNESKSKLNELKASGFQICNYQNMQEDLSINEWDIIIIQVESLFRVKFTARPFVAILDEVNAIMRQMSSGTNARESENTMHDVLRTARHVLNIDAFTNISILIFLQIYRGKNIRVVDNKYQPYIGETVEFIYDPNSRAEAM